MGKNKDKNKPDSLLQMIIAHRDTLATFEGRMATIEQRLSTLYITPEGMDILSDIMIAKLTERLRASMSIPRPDTNAGVSPQSQSQSESESQEIAQAPDQGG